MNLLKPLKDKESSVAETTLLPSNSNLEIPEAGIAETLSKAKAAYVDEVIVHSEDLDLCLIKV